MVGIGIKNLSFAYRKTNVLRDLSLDIPAGKLIMIIGPNGSGKSTLLKCINGILPVKYGEIMIGDSGIDKLSRNQKARRMAYVPQQENQIFSGSVYETILMGRKPYIGWAPGKSDYKIVDRVLNDLDLEKISAAYLIELSGGQRQRVIIGRALAQQPDILLLDEPTANLDLKHQLEVMQLLKALSVKNITVVIAIHDLNLAAKYGDRLIMLDEGQCFAMGGKEILNPENIRQLYGVEVNIIDRSDAPVIIPDKPVSKK